MKRRSCEEDVEPLSEDEAIELANGEPHAMRRERREVTRAVLDSCDLVYGAISEKGIP